MSSPLEGGEPVGTPAAPLGYRSRPEPIAPIMKAVGIQKAFRTSRGDLAVLRDVHLEVTAGECVAIIGPSLRRIGAEAIPALLTALKDADAELRRLAARTLGHMLPTTALVAKALDELKEDADAAVRAEAAEALNHIMAKQVTAPH